MSARVTWLLPVKNGMPFLPEALASLERQTYRDWEVLAWDNGSIDGSVEELNRWIPQRLPGRVVTGRPLRLGKSLAEMVMMARTSLCARIDADDICLPKRLERQVAFLETHPTVAALGSQYIVMDTLGKLHGIQFPLPNHPIDCACALLFHNSIAHPSVLFRRDAVL